MAPTNDIDVRETLDSNDSSEFKRYFRIGSSSVRLSSSCRSSGCGTTTCRRGADANLVYLPSSARLAHPRDHMTRGRLREVKLASAEVLHRPVWRPKRSRRGCHRVSAPIFNSSDNGAQTERRHWACPRVFKRPRFRRLCLVQIK
jgi:hypothetical protein